MLFTSPTLMRNLPLKKFWASNKVGTGMRPSPHKVLDREGVSTTKSLLLRSLERGVPTLLIYYMQRARVNSVQLMNYLNKKFGENESWKKNIYVAYFCPNISFWKCIIIAIPIKRKITRTRFSGFTGVEAADAGWQPLSGATVCLQEALAPGSGTDVHRFAGENVHYDERREGGHPSQGTV